MSSAEFWDLTWEEYYARQDRHEEQEKRWDLRFGVVASMYINCKLKEGSEPVKPGAFFGHEEDTEPDREMTPEETIAAAMKAFQIKQ